MVDEARLDDALSCSLRFFDSLLLRRKRCMAVEQLARVVARVGRCLSSEEQHGGSD